MHKPYPAYSGTEPYVFVCYAHADAAAVYADLVELKKHGVNVWYDEGIPAGAAWRGEIAAAIAGAERVLFYISAASLKSSHCLREVDYAINHDREVLPIYLEQCSLPAELELVLNRVQALFRAKDHRFIEHLLEGLREKGRSARPAIRKRNVRAAVALLCLVVAVSALSWLERDRWFGRATTAPATSTAPSANDRYLEGLALMERWDKDDNVDKAIGLFREVTEIDPGFALAYARLAEALRLRYAVTRDDASLSEAVEEANEAVRLNPRLAPVQVALAQVQQTQGHIDLAFAAVERALDIDPRDASANQTIAKIYEQQGRLDDAVAAFKKAVALAPDSLVIRDSYANFLFRQTRFEEAAEQWRAMLRLAPDHFGALVNLGSALSELNRLSDAIAMYERALAIKPTYMAYVNLGTANGRAQHYAEAQKAFEQALKIDDTDSLAWGNLGYVYDWQGKSAEAKAAFERAIELAEEVRRDNPRDALVNSDLALYYAKTRQTEPAQQRLDTAMTLAPESAEVAIAGAEVCELTGQRDRAVELALKALELGLSRQRLQRNPELTGLLSDARIQAQL